MGRCDICIEEPCKGKHGCNCSRCSKLNSCYRMLHPTIRLTTKYTQECSHCCFSCSTRETKMMNLNTTKIIITFIENNDITSINLIGGEFFLNPDWFEILYMFTGVVCNARLVTTGDWISNQEVRDKLIELREITGETLWIAISNDKWHSNVNVRMTEKFLKDNGFTYVIWSEDTNHDENVVPIGRAEGGFGFYWLMGCYCQNPKKQVFLLNQRKRYDI